MKKISFGSSYTLTPEESRRISVMKFVAILVVVLIHSFDMDLVFTPGLEAVMGAEYLISQVIGRSMVPVFYLLSAILLFKSIRSYGDVLKSKAKTVLVPYLLWNTFWIVLFILLQSLSFTKAMFGSDSVPILQRSVREWLQLYGIGAREPMDYPLWYVRDLILIICLSPLLWKVTDKFPGLVLAAALAVNAFGTSEFPLREALIYTLLGAWIVKHNIHMEDLDRIPLSIFTAVYVLCCAALFFTKMVLIHRAVQLVGVFYWIRLTAVITGKPENLLAKGAESVFLIFAAHELTLSTLKKVFAAAVPQSPATVLLGYFLLPALVIALCIAADRITRKLVPGFHRLITGGR